MRADPEMQFETPHCAAAARVVGAIQDKEIATHLGAAYLLERASHFIQDLKDEAKFFASSTE